jgi:hypothetical protein
MHGCSYCLRPWRKVHVIYSDAGVGNVVAVSSIHRILPPVSYRSRLGHRHGPKVQFWFLFSIKIFIEKLYMYIFMNVIFKTNLFIWFSHFQTQRVKSYSWLIFPNPHVRLKSYPKRLLIVHRREYMRHFFWDSHSTTQTLTTRTHTHPYEYTYANPTAMSKPANSFLLSEQISTSHQPLANRTGYWSLEYNFIFVFKKKKESRRNVIAVG